jgi:hypothetical protein
MFRLGLLERKVAGISMTPVRVSFGRSCSSAMPKSSNGTRPSYAIMTPLCSSDSARTGRTGCPAPVDVGLLPGGGVHGSLLLTTD